MLSDSGLLLAHDFPFHCEIRVESSRLGSPVTRRLKLASVRRLGVSLTNEYEVVIVASL
jgi:hypothetical protein